MYVAHDYGKVRIVHDGDPFNDTYDIRVETLVDGEWKFYNGFNSLSDDYAHTNAKDSARRAIAILASKAAENLPGVPK